MNTAPVYLLLELMWLKGFQRWQFYLLLIRSMPVFGSIMIHTQTSKRLSSSFKNEKGVYSKACRCDRIHRPLPQNPFPFPKVGYTIHIINPIQSVSIKNVRIRKVKNDKMDARKIALLIALDN